MNSPTWTSQLQSGSGAKTASNTSLIDWDKGVLSYVYSCMYPEPALLTRPVQSQNHPNSTVFRKAHRRIVSATSPHTFQTRPSRLAVTAPRVHGHCRNASDPGIHIYFPPPPPIFLPPTTTVITADEKDRDFSHGESSVGQIPPSPPSSVECIDKVDTAIKLPTDKALSESSSDTTCLVPCLQPWANPIVLLICLCAMAFFQALVSSGYLSSILSTLERRFDLTSQQVGYMYCCYEITSVIATIGFSFVNGRRQNRPRLIGFLGVVLGLGFGLFSLPHWLSGPYNPGDAGLNPNNRRNTALCSIVNASSGFNSTSSPSPFVDRSHCNQTEVTLLRIGKKSVIASDYTVALPVFCCAMALAGFGSSSLFVLGPTFFWDNLPPRQYPLYSGLLYSSAGLGPAFGFMAGAAFLQIYIDGPSSQPPALSPGTSTQLDVYSQSWLGAWWMGMLIFGMIACLPALPVLAFPKSLPAAAGLSTFLEDCKAKNEMGDVSGTYEPNTANSTAPSSPENDGNNALASGDGLPVAKISIVGRFPEPIPEASESLMVHSTPSTCQTSSTEVDCHLHRRQASRGGGLPISMLGPVDAPPKLSQSRRRYDKGFASMCARLRANFSRKYLGRIQVFRRVVTNPIWLGVTATTVTENTIVSAYLTFAAKYLQSQYRIPAHISSIHTGAVVVPSAVLGVLTGALLMRHFRPSITRTLFASLIPLLATLATVLILMLGFNCSTNQMAGVTATYDGKPNWQFGDSFFHNPSNLTAPCNSICRVTGGGGASTFSCPVASDYNPVCWELHGNDGSVKTQMSFLNPCLAGCSGQRLQTLPDGKVIEIYTDCNCVTNSTLTPEGVHSHRNAGLDLRGGTTKKGVCNPQCPHYAPFLFVTFLTIFLTSVNQNPSNVVTLSCVRPEDGTAALALQVFFARTLAFIPTPVYFGALMDHTCRVRALPQRLICESEMSNQQHLLLLSATKLASLEGACLEYDVHTLPFAWLGGVTVFKCLSIVFGLLTWRYSCRLDARQKRELDSTESDNSEGPQGEQLNNLTT